MWQNEKKVSKKKLTVDLHKIRRKFTKYKFRIFIFFMFSKKSKEELLPRVRDSVGWLKFTELSVERGGFCETSVNILKVRTLRPFEILMNFNHVWWPSSQLKPEVQDRKTTIFEDLLQV